MYKNILIPVALDHAIDLGMKIETAREVQAEGAKITLVAVLEEIPSYVAEFATVKPVTKIKESVAERLRAMIPDQVDIDVAVLSGKPGVVIPELAESSGADLIIIASHRPGVESYFLGSSASRVVRRAPCSVMVLRQDRASD